MVGVFGIHRRERWNSCCVLHAPQTFAPVVTLSALSSLVGAEPHCPDAMPRPLLHGVLTFQLTPSGAWTQRSFPLTTSSTPVLSPVCSPASSS